VLAAVAFAANDTFISEYPYDGFGAITAAANIVGDSVNLIVAVTVAASRLPPVLVVSTSTYDEPAVCGGAVGDGDAGTNVPDVDGVNVGVGDTVRLSVGVPLDDGVKVGEEDGLAVVGAVVGCSDWQVSR
jgi:hypothetical protein